MSIYAYYLLIVNVVSFWIMLYDKNMAKIRGQRVPERTLFCLAAIGGSIGCILGMYLMRHKTQHITFTVGMPAILVIQVILVLFLFL